MKKSPNPNRFQDQKHLEYSNKVALFEGEVNLVNYNKSIVKKFNSYFKLPSESKYTLNFTETMVDFGAGAGNLSQLFLVEFGVKPICIEVDPELQKVLAQKSFRVASKISEIDGEISMVFCSNVLEHIYDDLGVLKELYFSMAPKAKLAIYVPALNFIFSELDTKAGHFRRYERRELIKKVAASGFVVEKCFYGDSLGVMASLVLKIFGYRNKLGIGAGKSLIFYDRFIYPMSQILDSWGMRYVAGKNLLLFAEKN